MTTIRRSLLFPACRDSSISAAVAGVLTIGLLLLVGCGPQKTRVVLITLDTLRLDSYESATGETDMPRLRAWAEGAAVFERFYSATSTTQPSHASMFTGQHPWQHGVTRNGQTLAAERVTVTEALHAAGFSTAAVIASFPLAAEFGFDQGFGVYDGDFDRGQRGDWDTEHAKETFFSRGDEITRKAIAQIDMATADRQFFWFHYFDPHDPYGDSTDKGRRIGPMDVLKQAMAGKDPSAAVLLARELYDQDVAHLDRWLATVLERLEADAGRYATHVIVVADHGESFGEDGSMAHGTRLTAGQIHVPCLIRSPRVAAGRRQDLAGSVDIATTLLALAGVDPGETPLGRGRNLLLRPQEALRVFGMRRVYSKGSLFPRLDGKKYPTDIPMFYTVMQNGEIVKGNAREIEDGGLSTELRESLRSDLRRLFHTFELELDGTFEEEELSPEVRDALEALGYIG